MFSHRLTAPDCLHTVRPCLRLLPLPSPSRVTSDPKTDLVAVLLKVEAWLAVVEDALPEFYRKATPCRDEVVTFAWLERLPYFLTTQYKPLTSGGLIQWVQTQGSSSVWSHSLFQRQVATVSL